MGGRGRRREVSSNESDVEVEEHRDRDETNWLSEDDGHSDSVQGRLKLGESIARAGRREEENEVSIIELDSLPAFDLQLCSLSHSPRCVSLLSNHAVE